jgi:hypothetical protein
MPAATPMVTASASGNACEIRAATAAYVPQDGAPTQVCAKPPVPYAAAVGRACAMTAFFPCLAGSG